MFLFFGKTGMVGARVGMTISVVDWIHVDHVEVFIHGFVHVIDP